MGSPIGLTDRMNGLTDRIFDSDDHPMVPCDANSITSDHPMNLSDGIPPPMIIHTKLP
jgi:hypothetical protein